MKTIPAALSTHDSLANRMSKASRHFVTLALRVDSVLVLPEEVSHHITRVTRSRTGDAIALFNGDGDLYYGTLTLANKGKASVQIELKETPKTESLLQVTLLQGLASSEKTAWAIEKATELGAVKIIPVVCDRSVAQISNEKAEKKQLHWLNIARAAAAQSGRVVIPTIAAAIRSHAIELLEALVSEHDQAIVLDPKGAQSMSTWSKGVVAKRVAVYIGPEGGLTSHEIAIARQAGFESLRMGPRILRTETAGPTAIAALQALLGDF
jgi:16S rRNA (uracil1498-N3)-methyltransferase